MWTQSICCDGRLVISVQVEGSARWENKIGWFISFEPFVCLADCFSFTTYFYYVRPLREVKNKSTPNTSFWKNVTMNSRTGEPLNLTVIRYQNVTHFPTVLWANISLLDRWAKYGPFFYSLKKKKKKKNKNFMDL